MDRNPGRSGASGGGGYTRTDFIEAGKRLGIRGEESSRAFTKLIQNAEYLDLAVSCSSLPCRHKYCRGSHRIKASSLQSVDRGALRDLVGRRSVTWKVLERVLTQITAGRGV